MYISANDIHTFRLYKQYPYIPYISANNIITLRIFLQMLSIYVVYFYKRYIPYISAYDINTFLIFLHTNTNQFFTKLKEILAIERET